MHDLKAVLDDLYALRNRGSKLGLDRMRALAAALGNPHLQYPILHVAGTNGKGSTCAILRSALAASGYRVGLFTSPHLVHLGERIEISGSPLGDHALLDAFQMVRRAAESIAPFATDDHPTFFEYITAMGLLTFARRGVEVAVLETGLGGRLDATNIVTPVATAITSIGLDHTEILGDTFEAIATEKAGIVKTGIPLTIGRLPPPAESTIRTIAASRQAPVISVEDYFGSDESLYPFTNLPGRVQRRNAATAFLVLHAVRPILPCPPAAIERGFRSVHWPARWQEVDSPIGPVILDATHNPEGCAALAENLRDLANRVGQAVPCAIGSLGLDRARSLIETVLPFASELILLAPDQPKAVPTATLRSLIPGNFPRKVTESTVADFARDHRSDPARPTVVTGSIYLIGEILASLHPSSALLRIQEKSSHDYIVSKR